MASRLAFPSRATPGFTRLSPHYGRSHIHPLAFFTNVSKIQINRRNLENLRFRATNVGDSYLDMWKNAVGREKKNVDFQIIADKSGGGADGDDRENEVKSEEELEKKSEEFQKILAVSNEERDQIQRTQVIERAAAAIAAARDILDERKSIAKDESFGEVKSGSGEDVEITKRGTWSRNVVVPQSISSGTRTPGPDFWSWTPPEDTDTNLDVNVNLQAATESSVYPSLTNPVLEKERSVDFLPIPFETIDSETKYNSSLPPFQSLLEVDNKNAPESSLETHSLNKEPDIEVLFSTHAAEAAHALDNVDELSSYGVNPDGSKWWRQMGVEQRPDGVICRWTMTRGVGVDQAVEWQEKYWEAADEFDYKELGSEKLGRDAAGNVWREFWTESMSQERGLVHLEKTADKWGKNGKGDEWQEKWWEHYDASGRAEKWADKWCSIDPKTNVEVGHGHVWHERWGEKFDGHGGSVKYTDKWAERCEGDGWTKWGDKWDEHFDSNGHGVKQGETWWEGKQGERWNRTWGEGHNGSGWLHKYGKSSCGEHWDTHVQQDTWYERFPHFGFYHCFDNSVQLRQVRKPSEMP